MQKLLEQSKPDSCWNKATPHEMVFVLLGRDEAAPITIRAWIAYRILMGKNQRDDAQITEAEQCAKQMEADFRAAKASKELRQFNDVHAPDLPDAETEILTPKQLQTKLDESA